MRIKTLAAASAAALMLALAGAGGASAATEFGDACSAEGVAPGDYTLTTLSAPSAPLSLTAPSSGVITKIKVNVASELEFPFAIPTAVKVLRSAGGNLFTVVGQQIVSTPVGLTVADARIPVQAGDRLGLHGEPFTYAGTPIPSLSVYCDEVEGALGAAEGNVAVGSTADFPQATAGRVPLAALIEPDADNDGYGDETQDKCPASAAVQVECPVAILDAFVLPKKSSVIVIVNTSVAAPVTVAASVKLPNEKKKAKASATAKLKKVTHDVTPGKLRYFSLKYPASVKGALADLPKGKKLKLKITAAATNVAGQVSTDKTTVKLKGNG